MPGHTYCRTITANRNSITKASSSLLDFSSIFPTLGETQVRYVNPAAQPALVVRPQSPSPWRRCCAPFPPPLHTEYSTAAAASAAVAPFLVSFLPGRLSAVASAAHHPHPTPRLLPAGRLPSPRAGALRSRFAGFRTPKTLVAPLPNSHPRSATSRISLHSRWLRGSHPHPNSPTTLSQTLLSPSPLGTYAANSQPALAGFLPLSPLPSLPLSRTRLPTLEAARSEIGVGRAEFPWGKESAGSLTG